MTTDNKNTKATGNTTVDVLQQAFDEFKLIYTTCTSFTKKDLLQDACDLFRQAYNTNNIGLCKALLKTLTDGDRKQALKYIDFIGLSITYNIDKDDLQVRRFEDYDEDKAKATFDEFTTSQREQTKANNKALYQQDLTKYKDKAKKQIAKIFKDLTTEQKTIFKNIINNM